MKSEFGKRFRQSRDEKKLSRAALAMRLGISPKTIQSWEMGRTFIEDLSLIPAIEKELKVPFAYLIGAIASADGSGESELITNAPAPQGQLQVSTESSDRALAGPQPAKLISSDLPESAVKEIELSYISAPLVKPQSADKEIADLSEEDIVRHCLFPADWCPRGRVVVAYRMGDSALVPAVPQGSTVLVDRRVTDHGRLDGRLAAIWLKDRGLRIRVITLNEDGTVDGRPYGTRRRGVVHIKFDEGDRILGRILGVVACHK